MFYIVVASRGWGKTYGCKKLFVERFLNKGEQFIWTRRYKSEFENNDLFFEALKNNNEFPGVEFKVHGGRYYINNEVAGYYMALSTASGQKGVEFAKVKWAVFDEVTLDPKSNQRYLKNEYNAIKGLYDTIDRNKGQLKFFLLGNNFSETNPVFIGFGVDTRQKIWKSKDKKTLALLSAGQAYIDFVKTTSFGKMNAGTDYGRMAQDGEFISDKHGHIEKKTGMCSIIFTFDYEGRRYGAWRANDNTKWWVSYDAPPNAPVHYTFSLEDIENGGVYLRRANQGNAFKYFVRDLKNQFVRYENINIKNKVLELVATLM